MRLATIRELLAHFGVEELRRCTGVTSNSTVYHWRDVKRIPEKRALQIAIRHPDVLVSDDEGYIYWLEESNFRPPAWVPHHWWTTYLFERQRQNLGVEDDRLAEVVAALEEIRDSGGDVSLALRYATTRGLAIPIYVERR